MTSPLATATPEQLETWAEEMAQWADANALGAKGRAFRAAADLLRAVAKVQRGSEKEARKRYKMEPSWFVNPHGELEYALADKQSNPDSLPAALAALLETDR